MFDALNLFCHFGRMTHFGSSAQHQFWTLPKELQEAVHLQVQRIKADLAIQAEVLYLDDLARVLNTDAKSLWNLRSRNAMPNIPVLKIGQKDAYWINHVAMWLMQIPFDTMPPAPLAEFTARGQVGSAKVESRNAKVETKDQQPTKRAKGASAQALLDRANQIFEESERKRSGK